MPAYKARFRLIRSGAAATEEPCRFEFDHENFTPVPERGSAMSLDLADMDWLRIADYEIRARLYSGEELALSHVGKVFTECGEKLRSARTDRLVRVLLTVRFRRPCRGAIRL